MVSIVATNEVELREIAGAIHDLWFARDAIDHDRARRRVALRLNLPETKRSRFFGWKYETPGDEHAGTLTLDDVEELRVIDDADASWYNVSSLKSEPVANGVRITLWGGIPIRVEVTCPRVAVRFDPPRGDHGACGLRGGRDSGA